MSKRGHDGASININMLMDLELYQWIEKERCDIGLPRSTFIRSIVKSYKNGQLKGELKLDIRHHTPKFFMDHEGCPQSVFRGE